jgi:HSP20 family molecular chaperone IbpA
MIYRNEFNDLFEKFFTVNPNYNFKTSVVKTNSEKNENYEVNYTKDGAYLFFEAPGFNKSNLTVEMESGKIFIQGRRTYKMNGEELTKTISKEFKIGEDYNSKSIEATIEDGLLTIFVPNYKKQEKKRITLL